MDFYSGKGVVRGRRGQLLGFALVASGQLSGAGPMVHLHIPSPYQTILGHTIPLLGPQHCHNL